MNITFEGTPFPNFPVVATEQLTVTVIGRDLLNRYLLECNGPSLEFLEFSLLRFPSRASCQAISAFRFAELRIPAILNLALEHRLEI